VPVEYVKYLVIAKDKKGEPLDFVEGIWYPPIPPGLAKTVDYPAFADNVKERCKNVEFRILDFRVVRQ